MRDRKAERRTATRREIVDAAWQVARDKGLAQVTLRDVAELVGMRAPSLYTHFASKHAIIGGMVDAQLANDPGGTRWSALLDRAINMFADNVGITHERTRP